MGTYTIGQTAERSGFAPTTLRFYEEHGLIAPVGRSAAGYRLYDDTSLARLSFIDRAKQLGCSLDQIAELADLWEADDCGPVQARLHELVTDKIADAQRRGDELRTFAAQLRRAAANLGGDPVDGPCTHGCACLDPTADAPAEPVPVVLGERQPPAIACTLAPDDIPTRLADWRRVLDHVIERQPIAGGLRLTLGTGAPLDQLVPLAQAEQGCCAFFTFAVTVDERGVALEVTAPADGAEVLDALFRSPPGAATATEP